ncbi:helix-turn-helix domain-containing protein [Nocardia halotolerans]|uniref:Helix-turn-helix domain-containing protein n=1 Tax=Nocardia halotolerans TaxID=1755878 RepID=A0ABV8VJC4_9NOCA
MEDAHVSIAGYLRERRESAGLTRAALSRVAGISPALIQKIEQGTRAPTLESLTALFDALEVPDLFRGHIVTLSLAHRYGTPAPVRAPVVPEPDRRLVEGLSCPASLQQYPTFDVLAVNAAWERRFPGLVVGTTVLEWLLLDPLSRRVVVDWERHAHLSVYGFRVISPGVVPQERIDELTAILSRAPEWERFWGTEPPPPHELDAPELLLADAETGVAAKMTMHNLEFSLPRRSWSLITFTPSPA